MPPWSKGPPSPSGALARRVRRGSGDLDRGRDRKDVGKRAVTQPREYQDAPRPGVTETTTRTRFDRPGTDGWSVLADPSFGSTGV